MQPELTHVFHLSQALGLAELTSHTCHIQACSARDNGATPSGGPGRGDERIWAGLDWVVAEVGRRVYYGTGGKALAMETVKASMANQGEDSAPLAVATA